MNPDTPQAWAKKIADGNRRALATALSLVESENADDRIRATELLDAAYHHRTNAFRFGVTGPGGAGKSTLVEKLGQHALKRGHRVAVLAVDPTSAKTGGSILGDKTRMPELSKNKAAFVRPLPSKQAVGGLAPQLRSAITLLEAAGYDLILVETVGTGQSEIAIKDVTDLFMLLLPPGGGDDLQGIKRGLLEFAHLVVVNKADGDLRADARRTQQQHQGALGLLRANDPLFYPKVLSVSAQNDEGVDAVLDAALGHQAALSSHIEALRAEQRKMWFKETLQGLILSTTQASETNTQAYADRLANDDEAPPSIAQRWFQRHI